MKGKILVFFDANDDEVNANVRDVHDYLKNPQNKANYGIRLLEPNLAQSILVRRGFKFFKGR